MKQAAKEGEEGRRGRKERWNGRKEGGTRGALRNGTVVSKQEISVRARKRR